MERNVIVFKSEDSLWQMLADGQRTWDARLYDFEDDRIRRLSIGHLASGGKFHPNEDKVAFENKKTGEILLYPYLGMEFAEWAPGSTFLKLGKLIRIFKP